jgi:hypothetical protein
MGVGVSSPSRPPSKAARPGDRILVRPGLYQEGLMIDKPLEIIGEGPVQEASSYPTMAWGRWKTTT